MTIKKAIKILENPSLLNTPDTNFLNEIHSKEYKTKRVNKEYLNSFSRDRIAVKKLGVWLDVVLILWILTVISIIYLAIN